jgi:uncharacterized protein YcbK (DUF882 family)
MMQSARGFIFVCLLFPVLTAAAPGAKPRPPQAQTPAAPKGYASGVKGWHAAASDAPELTAAGFPKLVLYALNTAEKIAIEPLSASGGFEASELERASQFLRDPRTGNRIALEPMMLNLVYALQVHFEVPLVRVISGYRTPRPGTHSNHGRGRAMDLVVPGHADEEVAKFARERGFVGVGTYPVSGFVHVDVRERSYFWIDASGPGRSKRERGILGDLAGKSDAAAKARGEASVRSFAIDTDVERALLKTPGEAASVEGEDEDEATP